MHAVRRPRPQHTPLSAAASLPSAVAGLASICLGLGACAGEPAVAPSPGAALLANGSARAALEASAVGIAGADDDFAPESDPDFSWSDDEDADMFGSPAGGAHLAPHLEAGLSRMVRRLQSRGQLDDIDWQAGASPPGDQTYARISVGDVLSDDDDDIVLDGFHTDAWVPIGADGRPAGDDIYMVKAGGVAGWQFTAGPFSLPRADGIELGLEDHGQPLRVPAGSRLVLHLPYNRSAGHPWQATGDALVPTSSEVEAASQEMVLRYDLGEVDPGSYTLALSRHKSDGGAAPQFCVPLTVSPSSDDDAPYGQGAW